MSVHLKALTGLRFIAMLFVVVFHIVRFDRAPDALHALVT